MKKEEFLTNEQSTNSIYLQADITSKNSIEDYLQRPLNIRNITLQNRLALAPLAGTTETNFRAICSEMGAALVTTELVSARGICHDPTLKNNYQYLEINPQAESPVAIQLFGHDPFDFRQAVEIILKHPILKQCAFIDINMGCPVKKIVKQGAGSALMKTPDLAYRIVESVVEVASHYDKAVSVKFRSGWDDQTINAPEFAKKMQEAGADLITIHARTREQFYSGKADWDVIKDVVEVVEIPVYGNGDVSDLQSIDQVYKQTNCSGFAIGRAAQGNPWIFRHLLGGDKLMGKSEWLQMIERHLDGVLLKEKNEARAIIMMRKQFSSYLKGKKNAVQARRDIMKCENKKELFNILAKVEICEKLI